MLPTRCVEWIERADGIRIGCPNMSIGKFRDSDTWEQKSWHMCAAHAAKYGHDVNPGRLEEDRLRIKDAVNNERMRIAGKLMEGIAGENGHG